MNSILDQIAGTAQFIPATTDEYLALQFAKRLGDEPAINRYLHYIAHHPVSHLMRQFHRAKREDDPAPAFHSSLIPPKP